MEATKSAMDEAADRGRLGCRLGWSECLRLGVGHASTVRPDPSTLGVVGERGSHHEGRSRPVPAWPLLSSPPWGQAGQVLPNSLHVLGLGRLELAQVDHFRRDIHLAVGGPGRVVPGVMHCPAGDPTGFADQARVLLANFGRFGLGPREVVAELFLDGPERFGQADAFALRVIGPAASDGVGELLVGG